MRPYIVKAPAYDSNSGGCMVIHRLCHELNMRGQEAYVAHRLINPDWKTPYYGDNRSGQVFEEWKTERDLISIHPEISFGNIFNTRTVVRYLLNNAGKLSGPKEFDASDILFAFSHMFNDFNLPEERIMFLPILDTDVFQDGHLDRNLITFYNGKGWRGIENDFISNLSEEEKKLPIVEIVRETSKDPHNLSNILQRSKTLYCYDNITAMTEISRLCGAPVIIVPNGEYTKEQYDKHELGWNGLGWGETPRHFDSAKFREDYLQLKETFYEKLDYFIEVTQND